MYSLTVTDCSAIVPYNSLLELAQEMQGSFLVNSHPDWKKKPLHNHPDGLVRVYPAPQTVHSPLHTGSTAPLEKTH